MAGSFPRCSSSNITYLDLFPSSRTPDERRMTRVSPVHHQHYHRQHRNINIGGTAGISQLGSNTSLANVQSGHLYLMTEINHKHHKHKVHFLVKNNSIFYYQPQDPAKMLPSKRASLFLILFLTPCVFSFILPQPFRRFVFLHCTASSSYLAMFDLALHAD